MKEILDKILKGMCPYLSCGVPRIYWELATDLARKMYGEPGVSLLEKSHKVYIQGVDASTENELHYINSWEGETEITPEVVIEQLNALRYTDDYFVSLKIGLKYMCEYKRHIPQL